MNKQAGKPTKDVGDLGSGSPPTEIQGILEDLGVWGTDWPPQPPKNSVSWTELNVLTNSPATDELKHGND